MSTESNRPDESPSPITAPLRTMWPDLSLLGVALIWGVNIPVMKAGLVGVEPLAFNAFRLLLSASVLSLLALLEQAPGVEKPNGFRKQVVIYAVIASGLYQLMFVLAITRTPTGNGSLIMATVPMWTALLARFMLGERLGLYAKVGLVIAFSGTLVVALEKGVSGDRQLLLGNFYMLMAALAWAWGTVQSRKVLPYISPMRLSAISAVMMLPLQFVVALPTLTTVVPHLREMNVLLPMIYAGVLSTGLALPMWSFGVRHSGAARAAVFQNLVPIVAIVFAWAVRNEPITPFQKLGGVLILSGLSLVRRRGV